MNINYIRICHFLSVAKHLNMNLASEEMHITQPAMSASINKLEEELGLPLFYRHKNRLILTEEARQLMPHFKQLRYDGENLENAVEMLKKTEDKTINLSFTVSPAMFSALFLTGLFTEYKDYRINVSYVSLQDAETLLLERKTDFAITYPPLNHSQITTRVLYSESIGVVLPETHPLAQKKLSFADLAQLKFHGMQKGSLFRSQVDAICQKQGCSIQYETESNQKDYYLRIQEKSPHLAFFSTGQNFRTNFAPQGGYVFRSVDDQVLNRVFGISWNCDSTIFLQHESLILQIKEVFPKLIATYSQVGQFSSQIMLNAGL